MKRKEKKLILIHSFSIIIRFTFSISKNENAIKKEKVSFFFSNIYSNFKETFEISSSFCFLLYKLKIA